MIKNIFRRVIAVVLCISIGFCISQTYMSKETSSCLREPAYPGTLILDESVPLGLIEDASVCMQALRLINSYRMDNGLQALLWNKKLEDAAAIRAEEANSCWSHTRPNGQPWHTVAPDIMYGENLGRGYNDADSLVQAWKESPTHNENLLYADFHYAAIVKSGNCYALEFA